MLANVNVNSVCFFFKKRFKIYLFLHFFGLPWREHPLEKTMKSLLNSSYDFSLVGNSGIIWSLSKLASEVNGKKVGGQITGTKLLS